MKFQLFSKILFIISPIIGAVFYYYAFYPGYMSHDSSLQYSQVLSGEWKTFSPIIMVLFWSLTDRIIEGPGGMFIFFQVLFWLGMFLFTLKLALPYWLKVIIILTLSLWPVNLMIFPHIWKDVGMISFLILAIGLIQFYLKTTKVLCLYLSLVFLVTAALFRFESVLYIVVLIAYVFVLLLRHFGCKRYFVLKTLLLSMTTFMLCFVISHLLVKVTDSKKITLWPTVTIWDMARVSVKINTVIIPSFAMGPGMTVEDLAQATHPWSNTTLYAQTKAGMRSGIVAAFSEDEYNELFKQWIAMIIDHPLAYFEHRWEVTKDLLRFDETSQKPMGLFFSRQIKGYSDNFPLNESSANENISTWIKSHKNNIVFKGWFYFVLELSLIFYLLISKKFKKHEFVLVLSLSGIVSVFVLAIVSPSAEQRYIIWLINSTLLSLVLFYQNLKNSKIEEI